MSWTGRGWVALVVHLALVAVMAPALDGWVRVARARMRGGPLPPIGQGWRDLVRLWRKPSPAQADASFVSAGAPAVALGAAMVAAMVTPGFCLGLATGEMSDLVAVAGLLGMSRAAEALVAFEAGAVRVWEEGRVLAGWAPAMAVLLLAAMVLVLISGGTGLDAAGAAVREGTGVVRLAGALAGLALLAVVASGEDGAGAAGFSGRGASSGASRGALLMMGAGQVRRVVGLSVVALMGAPFGVADAGAGVVAGAVGVACWVLKLAVLGAVAAGMGRRAWLAVGGLLAVIAAVLLGVQGRV